MGNSEKILSVLSSSSYSHKRNALKNGFFVTCIIFFKASVGFGFYSSQMYFFDSGWILGLLITILMTFIVGYAMYILCELINVIEKSNYNLGIENMEEVAFYAFQHRKIQNMLYLICKLFNFFLNYVVVLVNGINFSKFLTSNFGVLFTNDLFRDLSLYKLCFIIITVVLIVLILEPERMKWLSYLGFFGLVITTLYIFSIYLDSGFPNAHNVTAFNMKGFATLVGSQLYSLESIGTLVCIRSTMQKKSQSAKMVLYVMTLVGICFSMIGLLSYISNFSAKTLAFFYFPGNVFIKISIFIFYITVFSVIIPVQIANLMMLEEIKKIKKYLILKYTTDDLDTAKVLVFRVCITTIILLPIFFGIPIIKRFK